MKRTEDIPEEITNRRVTLKPIVGVPPRVYVPIIWGVGLLLVLLWVVLWPGIARPGAQVAFDSAPAGAEIRVDGLRVGATPTTVAVPAGERTVTLCHPFAEEWQATIDVPNRLFLSRFLPRRMNVVAELDEYAAEAAHKSMVEEFSMWSSTGEASAQFQHPWIASTEAEWLAATEQLRLGRGIVDYALHATQATQAADLTRAIFLDAAQGGPPVPAAIDEAVRLLIQSESTSYLPPELTTDLVGLLDEGAAARLRETGWYADAVAERATRILAASLELDESAAILRPVRRSFGGGTFVAIPGGTYVPGYPVRTSDVRGDVVVLEPLLVQETEVSGAQYALFLADEPDWRAVNVAVEGYLADFSSRSADLPVVGVPLAAAEAFATWFTDEYLRGSGLRAALPSADEWEYAAFLNATGVPTVTTGTDSPAPVDFGRPGALGLYHMAGNVWEWTRSVHGGNSAYLPGIAPPFGALRVVAGGSFANRSADHSRRGAHPESWSTPYLGFRLVLREVEDE